MTEITGTTTSASPDWGNFSRGGAPLRIDRLLDRSGKSPHHSLVKSPDMKNVYDGTVTLDAHGRATVGLPGWFEALNRDYRYQLTPIGAPAPNLHIEREVNHGAFTIAGGNRDQQVSWQVTGIRR